MKKTRSGTHVDRDGDQLAHQVATSQVSPEQESWASRHRVIVAIPVFFILLALFSAISMSTNEQWDLRPFDRTMEAVQHTTSVRFEPQKGSVSCPSEPSAQKQVGNLCGMANTTGRYKIRERHTFLTVTRPATGEKQRLHVLIREPIGYKGKAPGILFLHGIGTYDTEAFADIAVPFATAGYVTMVTDKPAWKTIRINHDYPAEAHADDQALQLLRQQKSVDSQHVGIYATSESGYVMPYLLHDDHHISFQIFLSPMLFSPRKALGFFISEDVSIVGANAGYQGFVRRAVATDLALFGLGNFDIDPIDNTSFAIPTFLVLGSKDVMTAHIDGATRVMRLAQQAGNNNFVIRDYPLANHVMRIGNEADKDTQYADHMEDDLISWSNGILRRQKQVAQRVAGADLYQAISLPAHVHKKTGQTIYMVILHVALILSLIVAIIFTIALRGRRLWQRLRHRKVEPLFKNGFGRTLFVMSVITVFAFLLFADGLAEVVIRIIDLCYGAAPQDPGFISWNWNVIVAGCILVIWTWARVLTQMLIVGMHNASERRQQARHLREQLLRAGADAQSVSMKRLVRRLARERRGGDWNSRHLFTCSPLAMGYAAVISVAMLLLLLFFAFWGVFVF